MKTINDYPQVVDLILAVDLAVSLFPEQYPDPAKVRNIIRINAKNKRIPGAKAVSLAGRQQNVWHYDRDRLVEWLTDPEKHKAGRPKKKQ